MGNGVTAFDAGGNHTCAVQNGVLHCWGQNNVGQLGDRTIVNRNTPVAVFAPMTGGVVAVAAGGAHSLGLRGDGCLYGWGQNNLSQLGEGTAVARTSPVGVSGACQWRLPVAAPGMFGKSAPANNAIVPTTTVTLTWSAPVTLTVNHYRYCYGTMTGCVPTTQVPSTTLSVVVSGLAPGERYHWQVRACATVACDTFTDANGGAWWAFNVSAPQPQAAFAGNTVATGIEHSCALGTNGSLRCWGRNSEGQLGIGTTANQTVPVTVTNMTSGVTAVSVGGNHTCAIRNGALLCWGFNNSGQLGDGTTINRTTPVTVTGMTSGVTAVAAGGSHTCAVRNGVLHCWGLNNYGQVGDGTTTNRTVPVVVGSMSANVMAVGAGFEHSCAVRDGMLYCWGRNDSGQLGDGTTAGRLAPFSVNGIVGGVTAVDGGWSHTCAIRNGGLHCWGRNAEGQLGYGTTGGSLSSPSAVPGMLSGVTAAFAGQEHTCAVQNGGLYCWGLNSSGQLGDGMLVNRNLPTLVSAPVNVNGDAVAGDAGGGHTLGLRSDGCLYGWGRNNLGQLGNGTTATNQTLPSGVSGACQWASPAASPGIFDKRAPANNAVELPTVVTLTWSAPVTLTVNHYRYCYGTATGCVPTTQVPSTTLGTVITGLLPGTTYYWQVRACATAACDTFTDADSGVPWAFSVSSLPLSLSAAENTLAAGIEHSCALGVDGALRCWGRNNEGQLGDGTTVARTVPVTVTGMASGVTAVAAGGYHTCAIRNGALLCWGWNTYGQLGDGTITNRTVPVTVTGMSSGVTAVAAGFGHTCAIRNRVLSCWGLNNYGQVGDGTTTNRATPVVVGSMSTNVTAAAAGTEYSCGVRDGMTYCWGRNDSGQLGDGTTAGRLAPFSVDGSVGGVTAINSGGNHTCAIQNGALRCWGRNAEGQLGNGTNLAVTMPVTVTSMISGVTAFDAGGNHTCAVQNGVLHCWGQNNFGQLGDRTVVNRNTPVAVFAPMTGGVVAVAAGGAHSLGLRGDGCLYGWGQNNLSQLGEGTAVARTSPVGVSGACQWRLPVAAPGMFGKSAPANNAIVPTTTVTLTWSAPVTLTVNHYRYCYGTMTGCVPTTQVPSTTLSVVVSGLAPGERYHWQVRACATVACDTFTDANGGAWWAFNVSAPQPQAAFAGNTVATGIEHSCALGTNGSLRCWGRNSEGQLGIGTTANQTVPVTVTNMTSGVTAVSVGGNHTCAIRNGALLCWGFNNSGQLGDGTTINRTTPVTVTGMTSGVTAVAAGGSHTCAVRNGVLHCWGLNNYGQVGDGTTTNRTVPVVVGSMSANVMAVGAGFEHSCAVRDGMLYCWGRNDSGQLGDGTTAGRLAPFSVNGIVGGVTAVDGGWSHTCAIRNGGLHCWGRNVEGQLGDETFTQRTSPVTVTNMTSDVTALFAGQESTCAIQNGLLLCWGLNNFGQLGDETTTNHNVPGLVVAPINFEGNTTAADTGGGHSLGLHTNGCLYSWGRNNLGQLGDGTTVNRTSPVGVSGLCDWVPPAPPPGPFGKSAPISGAVDLPNTVTLAWNSPTTSTVDHYRYCYGTTTGCTPTTQVSSTTLSVTVSGLALGTTYYWQVRACATSNCALFTDADGGTWWNFSVSSGPLGFSKASPQDGTSGYPTNVALSWNSTTGQGIVQYEYCVNLTPSCSSFTNVGTFTSANVIGLNQGTTYYWQVRACDDNGCTQANAGIFWSFQTAQAVGSPNKQSPGNFSLNVNTATTQLQWASSAGATEYKLCLGTASNLCNVVGGGPGVYASVGMSTSQPLSSLLLLPSTTYYWQVLATNGVFTTFADGSQFAFWSFTTLQSGPGSFNKVAPVFNATSVPTSNITFQWTPSSGAVSYTLCIGAFPGDCAYSVVSSGAVVVLPGPLPAGATLVWQVTAHNIAGTNSADNNTWWPLTTMPNAPQVFTKYTPANGVTGQPVGVSLEWQDVPNETYYQVCVGTSPGVCTLVNVTVTANTTNYALTGLSFGTTYWWQISACNTGGCTPANNGVSWSFSTLNPPLPGPFQKTTPANAALNVPTSTALVLLQWTASAQADGYEVCFGTNPGTCDLSGGGFQNVGNVLSRYINQLPFSVVLQPATTYYWQVRAYNNLTATRAFADGGVDFYFTTAAGSGPGAFGKDAPLNNAFNLPTTTVTLRWFVAGGASNYEVCVGTAVNSCDALPGNTWLNAGSTLSITLNALQPGTMYYWQVRAVNASGTTAANNGAWWSFTTQNAGPLANFDKAAPAQQATGVPTATAVLSWFVSTGASGYEVCVGSAPGLCEASGGWVNVGLATQWTPPALNAGRTYWWQVRALDSALPLQANSGQWWAFSTLNDPNVGPGNFGRTSPVSATASSSPINFTWTPAHGAVAYRVCVGTAWGLCDVADQAVTSATLLSLNLPTGNYWWQVTAVNAQAHATQADGGEWWPFSVQQFRAFMPIVRRP
jgi:alpha-tubulin suppressor-like RCC1 family protein